MNSAYMPYIVTEVFCILYSVTILSRLRPEMGNEREISSLGKMIICYILMLATDVFWALVENGDIFPQHYLNAAVNGVSVTAVAFGCYYWFGFVEARLNPSLTRSRKSALLISIPLIFICVLDISSIFTQWVFYITPSGEYTEGPLFWAQSVVTFAYLLLPTVHSVLKAVRTSSREKRVEYLTYVAYIVVPCVLLSIVDSYPTVPLFALSILLVIQVLFLTLYLDREHQLASRERELTESRTSVIMSQLQPHFLFNALTAIQDLCHGKAPEAEEAVVEFAEYLRGNIDSLRRSGPVSFSQELNHTRNYLALEQKRFAGIVRAEYNIRATDFSLPPLTLQPLVENAVRYGITRRENGGTIRISSEEDEAVFRIVISDDGVGFGAATPDADSRPHLGISSVRGRIEAMCGGSLTVDSVPGIGTTAVITVPKQNRPDR
jgi:hypothetical protein